MKGSPVAVQKVITRQKRRIMRKLKNQSQVLFDDDINTSGLTDEINQAVTK